MFNLVSTYETLEGHEKLNPNQKKQLFVHSVTLAKDQGGCRYLQKEIETNYDPELFSIIFDSVITDFMTLMMDPFGNYLT